MSDSNDPAAIFESMVHALQVVQSPDGRIDGANFGNAALMLAPLYDRIFGVGIVSNHLKDDIRRHGEGLRNAIAVNPEWYRYVEDMVPRMIQEKGIENIRGRWGEGIVELLWCKRALDYILRFIDYGLFSKTADSLTSCARQAYNEVLKPYHGMLVAGIVTLAFNLAPSRERFIEVLGFSSLDAAQHKLRPLVASGRPILAKVQSILEAHGCDFPDKVAYCFSVLFLWHFNVGSIRAGVKRYLARPAEADLVK